MKWAILACVLPSLAMCQMLAGGVSDTQVDPNDPSVQFAIKTATASLMEKGFLGSDQQLTSDQIKVVRARTQVVAGQNLFLDLLMAGRYMCNVTVWSRPWLQGPEAMQATRTTCYDTQAHAKRQLVGGVSQPIAFDPQHAPKEVGDALGFAVCAVNDMSNAMFLSIPDSTKMSGITYTKQLTAGMTFKFSGVPMLQTSCRKGGQSCAEMDRATLMACETNQDPMPQTCSFTVQYQAWMNPAYAASDIVCQ